MSAIPRARIWTGFFDKSGSPALKVSVRGDLGKSVEFDAILDTGFTGFICMPLLRALPLGLAPRGTASVELADGNNYMKLTAKGIAEAHGEEQTGVVVIEPSGNEVLLGMDFLRLFGKAMFVTKEVVLLVPEDYSPTA